MRERKMKREVYLSGSGRSHIIIIIIIIILERKGVGTQKNLDETIGSLSPTFSI